MTNSAWRKTNKRFVAFFDIMGFKDIVERNSHNDVVNKLENLKNALNILKSVTVDGKAIKQSTKQNNSSAQTKSITFSDSIVIFSKSNTVKDLEKIVFDSAYLQYSSLQSEIAIKGVLSYGEITVDFKNSLFFGKPIIDAYLLHDQLNMYTALLDDKIEARLNEMTIPEPTSHFITTYKVNLKCGKVTHKVITPNISQKIQKSIDSLTKYYEKVSGPPRLYVDNTLDFFNWIKSNTTK